MTTQVTRPSPFSDSLLPAGPFVVLGVISIIAGGLVAAATAPSPSEHGSWAAAYLVLVSGVAQIAFGLGQSLLARPAPSRNLLAAELVAWNAGNLLVIVGTLANTQWVVTLGGVLLVITLGLLIWAVRSATVSSGWPTWTLWSYRVLALIILVSVPVGLIIGQVKSG